MRFGFAALTFSFALATAAYAADPQWLPTGASITPEAAPGAQFQPLDVDLPVIGKATVGAGVTTALSADGHTLFLLTAGFNSWIGPDGKKVDAASTQHLFVYDVTKGVPALQQDVPVPNAYGGLALADDGKTLYVAGGMDDNVHVFRADDGGKWSEDGTPITLGHPYGNGVIKSAEALKPQAAGAALTADGKMLVVANYENDSIDVIDTEARKVTAELDLRPGKIDPKDSGVAGGEFPYWVAIKGSDTAYVSSLRDREIVVVALGPAPHVTARIKVAGNPTRLLLDKAGSRLFVALDNSDRVAVIDTAANTITAQVAAGVPDGYGANTKLPGASPNSLALSPDEKTLFVTEEGINAVGVIGLDGAPHLEGLIPTAWDPNAVSVSADGRMLYVANGKGAAGPVPRMCAHTKAFTPNCGEMEEKHVPNQYVWQKTTGGVTSIPVPDADTLKRLTATVADNNGYREVESAADLKLMAALRKHIKHVIYIVRENRTYDQVLGDAGADGDPKLVQFGPAITANAHALAQQFVNLDAFFDSGEASGNGWNWTTAARTMDATEKEMPVNYSDRGLTYDFEGTTRDVNVSLQGAERLKANPLNDKDPDLLPGPANQVAPDGPNGEDEEGYLWDAALRAHETIRNYGFFLDLTLYDNHVPDAVRIPPERDAFAKNLVVAIPANRNLAGVTDPYYRGFDNNFPDLYRYREWEREFSGYEKTGTLPQLETVRLMHDHTGDFKTALDGVNTPETQVADNDYAVGLLIARVAKSKFASSTLVFVIEDDAQDGPDHVDAHRSVAFVAGPYVKQGAVVSERYTTVNMVRTIEEVLGLKPLNFHDANARPMTAVFDLSKAHWSYEARVPDMLRTTQLPLPPQQKAEAAPVRPLHDAAYWARATKGFDFSSEDKVDPALYDRILWTGTMGDAPYPARRDGRNDRRKTANAEKDSAAR
jgi:YVTN family beta-propeller protein